MPVSGLNRSTRISGITQSPYARMLLDGGRQRQMPRRLPTRLSRPAVTGGARRRWIRRLAWRLSGLGAAPLGRSASCAVPPKMLLPDSPEEASASLTGPTRTGFDLQYG